MSNLRHIVSVTDVPLRELEKIYERASAYKKRILRPQPPEDPKILYTFFCESSTRTRSSFCSAAVKLHWTPLGTEHGGLFSSMGPAKNESLKDTIRVLSGNCDVLVLRHPQKGSAADAATVARVPVINGGDGIGEHPTQAYLDGFSIDERYPDRWDLTVTLVGDGKRGRTIHSDIRQFARALREDSRLARVKTVQLVSPVSYEVPTEIVEEARAAKLNVITAETLSPRILEKTDVIYMTRVQSERDSEAEDSGGLAVHYALTPERASFLPPSATILHPLPRRQELPEELDNDPRAYYFDQSDNGCWIRMAIIDWVTDRL